MGANEKHAATYHGRAYVPRTETVRELYGQSGNPLAFDRWLSKIRAEAKAEAWDECARSIVYEDGTPVEIASITNPYKEQS